MRGSVTLMAAVAALLQFTPASPTRAQEAYPWRTAKSVVPSASGSTTDSLARILAEGLQRRWIGSTVIVENISGAAMNIGARGSRARLPTATR